MVEDRYGLHTAEQADAVDFVIAYIAARSNRKRQGGTRNIPRLLCRSAEYGAAVALLEFVAIHRIFKKIGEIGCQHEIVIGGKRVDFESAEIGIGDQTDARRLAAHIVIDKPEPVDQSAFHGAFGYLVGRIPARVISVELHGKAAFRRTRTIFGKAVIFFQILVANPGSVGQSTVECQQQVAIADRGTARGGRTVIAEFAHRRLRKRFERVIGFECDRTCGGKISDIGEIRPFAKIDPLYRFGNDEIEIEIALPVSVRRHVDRHAVHEPGKIRAVIEIEPAQKILVRLARTGMLRGDDAGYVFDQLAGSRNRQVFEIGIADRSLRARYSRTDLGDSAAIDDDCILVGDRRGRILLRIGASVRACGLRILSAGDTWYDT